MPKIQLTTPEGEKLEFDLTIPSATVGRAPENDIVVPDGSVSSRHGKINVKGESIEIEDLGSTNGTHVGSERVERADIAPGGAFRFGNVHGVLVGAGPAPTDEPAGSPASDADAEETVEEEQAAPGGRTWSPPSGGGSPVISGLGATPCPANQRRGFGAKAKEKNSTGSTLMGLAGLSLAVCAAAAFFIFKMGS